MTIVDPRKLVSPCLTNDKLPLRWSGRSRGAKIDTSRIEAVVRKMEEDAEQVLIELDLTQTPRDRRAQTVAPLVRT